MGQRVRKPHRGETPSSARQLPILAALHARFPTLFPLMIHQAIPKVNPFLYFSVKITESAKNHTPVSIGFPRVVG